MPMCISRDATLRAHRWCAILSPGRRVEKAGRDSPLSDRLRSLRRRTRSRSVARDGRCRRRGACARRAGDTHAVRRRGTRRRRDGGGTGGCGYKTGAELRRALSAGKRRYPQRRPEAGRTAVLYRVANAAVQVVKSGTNEGVKVHDGRRAWRLLRSNPDYVANWRANGGLVVPKAPPFPLRRQTEADRKAARWNLLAWEAPWLKGHTMPFWADVPMCRCSRGERWTWGSPPRKRCSASWSRLGRHSGACGFATVDSSSRWCGTARQSRSAWRTEGPSTRRDAVGQILSYMGDVAAEEPNEVRGILVAGDFDNRARAAARVVPSLSLRRYRVVFARGPTGTRRCPAVTDHPERRRAHETYDGIEFGKRQGASRWDGVLPLAEDVEQDIGVEQYAQRLPALKARLEVMGS